MSDATSNFVNLLSSIDIFANLDKVTRKDIAKYFKIDRIMKGEKIIESGKTADRFFIILNANVELKTSDLMGHTKRKIELTDGSVIGEVGLLTNTPYTSDAIALENTVVFYLERNEFKALIQKHKSFANTMTHLMSQRMAHEGGINKVGRYTLTEKIGEGNMATVFEGYDPMLDRHVALKMLKYDLSHDEDFLSRFEQEAKVIAQLNHPNIVNVYETVNEYSTSFIVMERLRGKDLGQILEETGPLSISDTRKILYQVVCALEYAHAQGEKGIIHRDIKPANIFIDDQGQVKLTDFGVAKPPMDVVTTVLGTPKYLAPEIIKGEPFDGRADIYSVGIMAFTMLSGMPPFTAKTLNELLSLQVYGDPPDIKQYRPEIDKDLKNFIDSALIKNPDERISDWEAIKALLQPEANRELKPTDSDEIAFVTRLPNGSYEKTARIINKLKALLDEEEIEHHIKVLK